MVVVAALCFVATVLGYFFLEETLDRSKVDSNVHNVDSSAHEHDAKAKAALSSSSTTTATATFRDGGSKGIDADGALGSEDAGFLSTLLAPWLPPLLRDRTRFNVVLLYAALSVQGIGFDEMYNVYLATPVAAGGLGFTTNTIGSTLICYGVSQIFLTAPLFSWLEPRFGMLRLFQCMAVACAAAYFFLPLVPRFAALMGYVALRHGTTHNTTPRDSCSMSVWLALFPPSCLANELEVLTIHVFTVVRTQLSSVTVSHSSSFTSLTLFVTTLLLNPFTPLRRSPVHHRVFLSL